MSLMSLKGFNFIKTVYELFDNPSYMDSGAINQIKPNCFTFGTLVDFGSLILTVYIKQIRYFQICFLS